MKNTFRIFSTTIFLIIIINSYLYSQSNWLWQNPLPHGNNVNNIKFINKYTGWSFSNYGYSYKSTDGGKNWIDFILPNNPTITASSFYKYDSVYFTGWLGGKSGALYKTTNSGINWIPITISSTNTITDIYFRNQNTGYLSNGSLFKTTDGGNNWFNIPTGLSSNPVNYVFFINDTVGYYGGIYVAGSGQPPYPPSSYFKINKTSNAGNNWINVGYTEFLYSTHYMSGIYFKDLMNGIAWGSFGYRRTTDGGNNWAYVGGIKIFDIKNWDLLYGTGNNKIQKSTDFGYNWTTLDSINTQSYIQSCLFVQDTMIINVGGTNGNILNSSDGGVYWTNSQYKITDKSLNSITALDSLNLFAFSTGNNVIKSTNGGNNWQIFNNENLNQSYPSSVFFLNTSTGWIGSTEGKIFKTVNGGSNWILLNIGNNSKVVYLKFFSSGVGFAQDTLKRIYKSTDWGINWNYQGIGSSTVIQFINSETGYSLSSTLGNTLKKSTDSGASWTTVSVLSDYYFRDFKFISDNIVLAPSTYSYPPLYVFINFLLYSSNGGVNWSILPGYSGEFIINNFHAVDSNIIYFSYQTNYLYLTSQTTYLYQTSNRGLNWNIYNIADPKINAITSFNKNLWIAGNNGMIIKGINVVPIGIKNISSTVPSIYFLSQNFPNPFNPVTKIKYQITGYNFVSVKIFDIL